MDTPEHIQHHHQPSQQHGLFSSPGRPCLLPAFEPSPSSSSVAGVGSKRKFDADKDSRHADAFYPTPVPTSSTGMLASSSPPRARHGIGRTAARAAAAAAAAPRPGLTRSVSALSERAPLGPVPSLEVPADGEAVLMGRSSNSSDYQLSANRLISRVHVKACYVEEEGHGPRIEVECLGWNGCKVHLRGEVVELAKGDKWCSEKVNAHILVDVQDTRVLLLWPRKPVEDALSSVSSSPRQGSESPTKRRRLDRDPIPSSPPMLLPPLSSPKLQSPVSLDAGEIGAGTSFDATFIAGSGNADDAVQIYEDADSEDDRARDVTPTPAAVMPASETRSPVEREVVDPYRSSSFAEVEELSEHDEENEPIVHSFGPYGDNILAKFASFQPTASPSRPPIGLGITELEQPAEETKPSPKRHFRESPIKNHVINQLAFSRAHSIPLSTIFSNVPSEMKKPRSPHSSVGDASPKLMRQAELRAMLELVPCVGHISREGKDAAGKTLEDEFYYLPDLDDDEIRRNTVSVARPPLRNVRKQHKQYYWKKPR